MSSSLDSVAELGEGSGSYVADPLPVGTPETGAVRRSKAPWLTAARAILLLAAVIRVTTAIWDQGLVWPDEIFQTLEQAHRFAFHWGIVPWEFRDGARSWLFPGMIGIVWKAAATLGLTRALAFVRLAKLLMAAVSVAAIAAGMRLAKHLGGHRAELFAGLFLTLSPPLVIYGSRVTTETASAPLIVGAALLLEANPTRRRAALAGVFAALMVLFRYQNGLLAAGFLILLLARRQWILALYFLGPAVLVALLGGALDWVTWGSPFHPLVVYLRFTFAPGGPGQWGNRWGDAPFSFFSDHLATLTGLLTYVVLLLGFGVASRRARGLVLVVLFFFVAHGVIPHKELRFVTPAVPLALALAAVGVEELFRGLRARGRPMLLLAACCSFEMMWRLRAPTLVDLGYPDDNSVVWHANEDYYRNTLAAAEHPDLCGIIYSGIPRAWTSGYTYLHRNVPVFFDVDLHNLPAANYLVDSVDAKPPFGWKQIFKDGRFALYRRDGTCGPVPLDWTLDML